MWGTFYGHSAYIQKTLVTCQGEARNLTFTQRMVSYGIGTFGAFSDPFRHSSFTIDPYGQKIQVHITYDYLTSLKIIFTLKDLY